VNQTTRDYEWYADKHGTVYGYLLHHPKDPNKAFPYYGLDIRNGIPITDVAEWMGHRSLDITFKIY
jgi:hypothetical protein